MQNRLHDGDIRGWFHHQTVCLPPTRQTNSYPEPMAILLSTSLSSAITEWHVAFPSCILEVCVVSSPQVVHIKS